MTYTDGTLNDVALFGNPLFIQGIVRRNLIGAALVGVGTLAAAWVVVTFATMPIAFDREPDAPQGLVAATPSVALPTVANPYGALHGAPHVRQHAPLLTNPAAAPDLREADSAPEWFLGSSLPSDAAPSDSAAVPLPPKRPVAELVQNARLAPSHVRFRPENHRNNHASAPQAVRAKGADVAPDNRNFLEKLFNIPQQPAGTALGYAQPESANIGVGSIFGRIAAPISTDNRTAIYDIQAHTVYMPNGERLEAHSGLGARLDDPSHVDEKNRGPTPPHEYELALRGPLFHGIAALRLAPVGGGSMFGRTGLLAHTYMLGPTGASNGCVSFRDYSKFLQAFQRGEVTRLVVVPHLG